MKRIGCWLSGLMLLAIANSAFAEVFCVNTALMLQNALVYAASNGEDDQIQVAQGTYSGNFVYGSGEAKGLEILGGFTTGCTNRVIDPELTVIDGNQAGSVLKISVPDVTVKLVIQGITVKNGKSTYLGGGLYTNVGNNSLITLDSNIFMNNAASSDGGGVYVSTTTGSVTLTSNTIQGNMTLADGGGIYVLVSMGSVTFTNNTIQGNTANSDYSYGGGVHVTAFNGSIYFTNNSIQGNRASSLSSYYYDSGGGGLYVNASLASVTFTNNTIQGNETSYYGGGMYLMASYGSITFINNTIKSNTSRYIKA